MSTLLELFDKDMSALNGRLNQDATSASVIKEAQKTIDALFSTYRKEEDRGANQERLAPFLQDIVRSSVSIIATASETEIWTKDETGAVDVPATKSYDFVYKIVQACIVLALFFLLWSQKEIVNVALLLCIVIVEAVFLVVVGINKHKSAKVPVPAKPTLQANVKINIGTFLTKLEDIILCADKTLNAVTNWSKPLSSDRPAFDSDTLDFFQDLLQAERAQNGEYALTKIETVPYILEQHGIQVIDYDVENQRYFEIRNSTKPIKTIKPALVENKSMLRRGVVAMPK